MVVDSANTLLSLLDDLISLPVNPPSLYLELKGHYHGRHGSVPIVSLYVLSRKKIYLIDIHRLGKTAFSTTNSSAISLKTILESPTIPKVTFNICNNSNALFSYYEISVGGIKDLQLMELMELATRKGSKDYVAGLAKCIENDSHVSTAAKVGWRRTKEGASRLYDPRKGGRYEIFNERPMRSEIVQYCASDVALLPGLYNVYNAKLCLPGAKFWQVQVREATKNRIKLSQSPGYDGQIKTNARGPWDRKSLEQAIDDWNDDVLFDACNHDNWDDYEVDAWYETDDL